MACFRLLAPRLIRARIWSTLSGARRIAQAWKGGPRVSLGRSARDDPGIRYPAAQHVDVDLDAAFLPRGIVGIHCGLPGRWPEPGASNWLTGAAKAQTPTWLALSFIVLMTTCT